MLHLCYKANIIIFSLNVPTYLSSLSCTVVDTFVEQKRTELTTNCHCCFFNDFYYSKKSCLIFEKIFFSFDYYRMVAETFNDIVKDFLTKISHYFFFLAHLSTCSIYFTTYCILLEIKAISSVDFNG